MNIIHATPSPILESSTVNFDLLKDNPSPKHFLPPLLPTELFNEYCLSSCFAVWNVMFWILER